MRHHRSIGRGITTAVFVAAAATFLCSSAAQPASTGAAAGVALSEDFETFPIGHAEFINGWHAGGRGWLMYATDINPISGARSGIHVADGSGLSGLEFDSPEFGPVYGTIRLDIKRTSLGCVYQAVLRDTGNQYFITRINLEPDGRILVGQLDNEAPIVDFVDVGMSYAVGEPFRLCITNEPSGVLRVYVNCELALIGQSVAHAAYVAGLTSIPPQGIGQLQTWSDNEGTGGIDRQGTPDNPDDDTATGIGDNYYLDNVFVSEDDFTGQTCDDTPLPCSGDANGDTAVDIDDVVSVVLDFGTDGALHGGDVNGSGLVDIDDIVHVVVNFGRACC